ncbi:tetratricopeptide repeat protein [Altererythrobacter sp. CAU 1778]
MVTARSTWRKAARGTALALAAGACVMGSVPALAQETDEARLRKIEAEVRALQRRVFPGSDGRYFEPEVTSAQPTQPTTVTTPSSTAVTDILLRLDALEGQIAQLTSQTEQNTNAIAQLQAQLGGSTGFSGSVPAVGPATTTTTTVTPATSSTPAATVTTTTATPPPPPPVAGPSAERIARVQAIAKPQTDDAADDEYSYGFRLWEAGLFPEAQQQLQMFVEKYPSHWRATYGRNLLGRAYLDDGKPREAAPWFLQNYQANKGAERAGDSLLYLAESMIAMDDTRRACIALAEFGDTYPALAAGRLQSAYEANRKKVTCN